MHNAVLLFGPPGSGKTALATSSFWDFRTRQPIPGRTGRLIRIGRESNKLGLPNETVRHFPLPATNPLSFMEELEKYCRALVQTARQGKGLTDIVFDGWSELNYIYTMAYEQQEDPRDRWETWRMWKQKAIAINEMLDPDVLGANVFATARVAEFRKPDKTSSGKDVKGDPEWMGDFAYHPAVDGWLKHNLGYYYNFIVFMDSEYRTHVRDAKKVRVPTKVSSWLPVGEYLVKNSLEYEWQTHNVAAQLDNVLWADVEGILTKLEEVTQPANTTE